MFSVGRYGVARLQMNVGHMDGMHCFIDSSSILVKIKSVSIYNCRTVYLCMYVCIMYVCVYVCMRVYMYVFTHVNLQI